MSSDTNPFALYFCKSPMVSELEKDLLYRQMIAFIQIKPLSDMMYRLGKKKPNENDFYVRDVLNTGLFPEEREHPGFFHYGKQHFRNLKSLNSMKVYEKIHDNCMFKKRQFWVKNSRVQATETAQLESKGMIKQAINSNLNPYRILMVLAATGIVIRYNMWLTKTLYMGILYTTAYWLGGNMGRYASAKSIFNDIEALPDPTMEQERQDIVNYCFLFDADVVSKTFLLKKNQVVWKEPESKK